MLTAKAIIDILGGIRATIFAGLALLFLVAAGVQSFRHGQVVREFDGYKARVTAATAVAKEKALEAQRAAVAALEDYRAAQKRADDAYQAGRDSAVQYQNTVVADLRAGNLRLREQWRSCMSSPAKVGEAGSAAGVGDQTADLPAEGIGRILRYAGEADSDILWLQQTLNATRTAYNQCAGIK